MDERLAVGLVCAVIAVLPGVERPEPPPVPGVFEHQNEHLNLPGTEKLLSKTHDHSTGLADLEVHRW